MLQKNHQKVDLAVKFENLGLSLAYCSVWIVEFLFTEKTCCDRIAYDHDVSETKNVLLSASHPTFVPLHSEKWNNNSSVCQNE
jgi:hypothetical protein